MMVGADEFEPSTFDVRLPSSWDLGPALLFSQGLISTVCLESGLVRPRGAQAGVPGGAAPLGWSYALSKQSGLDLISRADSSAYQAAEP
jgi:hypothetical protein